MILCYKLKMLLLLKSPFLILTFMNFLIFYPAINSALFWDDNLLFQGSILINAENPLVYWFRASPFYKAWPVFYGIMKTMYSILGDHYWAYKFFSLVLHTTNATLLFSLLSRTLSQKKSIAIALLFSLHPIQSETVLWVFQLNTILATFFLLLSVKFYLKGKIGYIPSLLAFFLSLNSKIIVIAFPLLLVFHLYRKKSSWKKLLLHPLPFLLLSCYSGYISHQGLIYHKERFQTKKTLPAIEEKIEKKIEDKSQSRTETTGKFKDSLEKALTSLRKLAFYAQKSLIPFPIMFIYPSVKLLSFSGFLLLIITLLFFILRRHNPSLDYFFLIWILAFIPISGIVDIGFFHFSHTANRYMYVGIIGLMGWLTLIMPLKKWLSLPLLLTLTLLSWKSAHIFAEPIALYKYNYRHNPEASAISFLIGDHYLRTNNLPELKSLINQLAENPHNSHSVHFHYLVERTFYFKRERWLYISKWYLNQNERERAIQQLKTGLIFHPEDQELKKSLEAIEAIDNI